MDEFLIILVALWVYPPITILLYLFTNKYPRTRKYIQILIYSLSLIVFLSLLFNISTTNRELDWWLFTILYFSISFFTWKLIFNPSKAIKTIGILLTIVVFGIGYFSSTLGIIGIGFITAEYSPVTQQSFGENYIYKETILGNAISDYRGKKIEVYKKISLLPFIEYRILKKSYFNYLAFSGPLMLTYDKFDNTITLSASSEESTWKDIIALN